VKYTRHETSIKAFGKHLREIRKEKKMTQEQLAFSADLEISQISRIERGIINTSISQILQIAMALGIHPKELFDMEFPIENMD
jgi:transcriptional regulator with XRE-family HTH domain